MYRFGDQATKKARKEMSLNVLARKKEQMRLDKNYEDRLEQEVKPKEQDKRSEENILAKLKENEKIKQVLQAQNLNVLAKLKENREKQLERKSMEEMAQREVVNILDDSAFERKEQRGKNVLSKFKENTQKKQQARLEQERLKQIEIEAKEQEKLEQERLKQIEQEKQRVLEQIQNQKEFSQKAANVFKLKAQQAVSLRKQTEDRLEQERLNQIERHGTVHVKEQRTPKKNKQLKLINADIKYLLK